MTSKFNTMTLSEHDLKQIEEGVRIIKAGGVVGMPTETVYGLAARIDSDEAIKKIFATKQRPFFDPLIVHVASTEQAKACTTDWSGAADLLAQKFWPGPLTLVLPKAPIISDVITSGLPSVGLRWPQHPAAQELIRQVSVPLAAPSANRFGRTSPTEAQHVRDEFAGSVFVIDAGRSEVGIESSVLSIKVKENAGSRNYELCLLRKGALLQSQIDDVMKASGLAYQWVETTDKKESPGHMKHHYMPEIPLVICRHDKITLQEVLKQLNEKLHTLPDEVEGVKIIKPEETIEQLEFLRLPNDAVLAARDLYTQLRLASSRGAEAICFIQSPRQTGEMWESVFDRLYKAASLIID